MLKFLPILRGLVLTWLLSLLPGGLAYAQVKVIVFDSVTQLPSQPIPFDEQFVSKIFVKSQTVNQLQIIQLANRAGLLETLERRFAKTNKRNRLGFLPLPEAGYRVVSDGKVRYLNIDYGAAYLADKQAIWAAQYVTHESKGTIRALKKDLHATYYLAPGKSYAFLWAGDVSEEVWAIFDQYRRYRTAPDLTQANLELARVRDKYGPLVAINKKNLGFEAVFVSGDLAPLHYAPTAPNNYPDDTSHFGKSLAKWFFYEPQLPAAYADLESKEKTLLTLGALVSPLPTSTDEREAYQFLNKLLVQVSPKFDSQLKLAYVPLPLQATKRLLKLSQQNSATRLRLLEGLETLDCTTCDVVPARHYATRLANVKATVAALEALLALVRSFPADQAALEPAVQDMEALYQACLKEALPRLTAVAGQREVLGKLVAAKASSTLQVVNGNTNVVGFETRNKLSIVPDFGVITTRLTKGGQQNPYPFMPYLGFSVNLHPINRENTFRSYPHHLSHYLSLTVGWTITSIDYGPKLAHSSTQDSISSYFKGKGTLLTGAGFRLGNAARITAGATWYFQYSQLPGATAYTERKLSAWPFIGLSLDMSLSTLLNGFTDLFGTVPRTYVPKPVPIAN